MTTATITDMAALKAHGYNVASYGKGWTLTDPDGDHVMIGDYGHIAPTKWEAVAEGLARIAADQ